MPYKFKETLNYKKGFSCIKIVKASPYLIEIYENEDKYLVEVFDTYSKERRYQLSLSKLLYPNINSIMNQSLLKSLPCYGYEYE